MTVALFTAFAFALLCCYRAPRLLGRWAGPAIALLPLGLLVYFATKAPAVAAGDALVESYEWLPAAGIELSFRLDGLSLVFALLILGIGALVIVYASGYFADGRRLGRFLLLIVLFMASMLGLVLADNVLLLFVFWELTGITSYFLIGFDHAREEARRAALQALLVTGLGGLGLLAGLVLLTSAGGSGELSVLATRGDAIRAHPLYLPALLLVLFGAFTKSAQFPFHFWLPNAMEAPTPASAYLHAATMVKAGVYLLARLSSTLGGTPEWFWIVTCVGAATMLTGALLAAGQTYYKRLLAYTTVCSLGILVMLLGLGQAIATQAAMLFLVAHALYKGALFLVAGAVDHETGERDVEKLGALRRSMPRTAFAAGLAALSMAGLPPLVGFISKELVFESALHAGRAAAWLTAATVVASGCVVAVAWLVGFRPFWSRGTTPPPAHDAPARLWIGPVLLALLGLVVGLFPGLIAERFVMPAARAVLGPATDAGPPLALWHGWNAALLLDAVALTSGCVVLLSIKKLRRFVRALAGFAARPEAWYRWSVDGAMATARLSTRVLQNGRLSIYVLVTILAAIVAVGGGLLRARPSIVADWSDLTVYDVSFVLMILIAAVTAIRSRSRIAAIAAMGAVGYGVALIFVFFGAPDLAITQLTVETLTVILFVFVFYHLPRFRDFSGRAVRVRDALVCAVAGAMMTVLVLLAQSVQLEPSISSFFVEQSLRSAHGRNVVNVILVDFRGLDTLGEITVLGTAALGVFALLRLTVKRGKTS